MNKIIASLLAVAAIGSFSAMADVGTAPAPASKDLTKQIEEGPYVETKEKGVKLSGYVDAGYSYNFTGEPATAGGLTTQNEQNKLSTDAARRGEFNLNAFKIALEKPLNDKNEAQAGFRGDIILGSDAAAFGHNAGGTGTASAINNVNLTDSLYVEQAYIQLRAPVGNGLDFNVGKFVTPIGYEVQERPANLNITYGNLFVNAQPLNHVGVITKYKWNDTVDTEFGVVNGANSDSSANGGFTGTDTHFNNSAALLASVNLTSPGGNANIKQTVYYAVNGDQGFGSSSAGNINSGNTDNTADVLYDVWGNWVPKFTVGSGKDARKDPLLLGFNIDLGYFQPDSGTFVGPTAGRVVNGDSDTYWGAAVYAKYQFNDIFSLANRVDYFHDSTGAKFNPYSSFASVDTVTGATLPGRVDIWSETLTASFDVIENLSLRTEYRLDYGDGVGAANNISTLNYHHDSGPAHQAVAEVVYSF